jgi:hypothetical protein
VKNRIIAILSTSLLAVVLAGPAFAQNTNIQGQTSTSNANSASGSNSTANSGSNARGGNSSLTLNNQAQPSSTTATLNTNESGTINQNIKAPPQIYVPNIVTGNACALGASAGASWMGAGFAVGGSWESMQCERRQQAALLHNAGYKEASRELMCDQREVYEAMKRAGTPCLQRPDWEPKGAVVQAAPVQVAPQPAPVVQPVAFNAANYPGMSDCLTAAYSAHADPAYCRGKR